MVSDLRERVARVFVEFQGEIYEGLWKYYLNDADAVIALVRAEVLEEAAMECERMAKVFAPQQVITDRCAAAIRALKEKT